MTFNALILLGLACQGVTFKAISFVFLYNRLLVFQNNTESCLEWAYHRIRLSKYISIVCAKLMITIPPSSIHQEIISRERERERQKRNAILFKGQLEFDSKITRGLSYFIYTSSICFMS